MGADGPCLFVATMRAVFWAGIRQPAKISLLRFRGQTDVRAS